MQIPNLESFLKFIKFLITFINCKSKENIKHFEVIQHKFILRTYWDGRWKSQRIIRSGLTIAAMRQLPRDFFSRMRDIFKIFS
jgi:hypothetical protein